MEYEDLYDKYERLFASLKEIIKSSEKRVLNDVPDEIFSDNVNFFVKSYLINICTYLEAFLQDVAHEHTSRVSERLKKAKIPHNFLYWKLVKEVKDKDLVYENATYSVNKREMSNIISGNPYKSIKAFQLIGVNLNSDDKFTKHKGLVNSIVNKRNNIIHHNDDASDISFRDLLLHINTFLEYMTSIYQILDDQSCS